MADTSNLTQFLTDVAGAIKEKTGKTDKIPAANFDTEIKAIETGGIKLFETVEKMQADTTAKEGNLAVVYGKEIQNMTVDMEVTTITFPETVTLPTAFTDNTYCRLRAVDDSVMFDGQCQLSKTSFRFNGWSDNGMIRVEYTSTDGITYTRTRFQGDNGDLTNPVDLGVTVKVESASEWNDNFGYFMQTGGMYFEGLFEYSPYLDKNEQYLPDYSTLSYIDNSISIKTGKNIITIDQVKAIINALNKKDYVAYDIVYDGTYYYILPYIKSASFGNCYYDTDNAKLYFAISARAQTDGSPYFESIPPMIYVLDSNLKLHSTIDTSTLSTTIFVWGASSSNQYKVTELPLNNQTMILGVRNSNNVITVSNESFFYSSGIGAGVTSSAAYTFRETYVTKYRWEAAPTQLTLENVNELLPGKIAYGKNGVVTGDGSIYNNLDSDDIMSNYFGLPSFNSVNCDTAVTKSKLGINFYKHTNKGDISLIENEPNTNYELKRILGNKALSYSAYSSDKSKIITWNLSTSAHADYTKVYDAKTLELLYTNVYGNNNTYSYGTPIIPNRMQYIDEFYLYRWNTTTSLGEIIKVDVGTLKETVLWSKTWSQMGQTASFSDDGEHCVFTIQQNNNGKAAIVSIMIDRNTETVTTLLDTEYSNRYNCAIGTILCADSLFIGQKYSPSSSSKSYYEDAKRFDLNTKQLVKTVSHQTSEVNTMSNNWISFNGNCNVGFKFTDVYITYNNKVLSTDDLLLTKQAFTGNVYNNFIINVSVGPKDVRTLEISKINSVKNNIIDKTILLSLEPDERYVFGEGTDRDIFTYGAEYYTMETIDESYLINWHSLSILITPGYEENTYVDYDIALISYIKDNYCKVINLYSNSITPEEYTTALNTSNEILTGMAQDI